MVGFVVFGGRVGGGEWEREKGVLVSSGGSGQDRNCDDGQRDEILPRPAPAGKGRNDRVTSTGSVLVIIRERVTLGRLRIPRPLASSDGF